MPINRETEAKLKLVISGGEEVSGSIDDVQAKLKELQGEQARDTTEKQKNEEATKGLTEAQSGLLSILDQISPALSSIASEGFSAVDSLEKLRGKTEDGESSFGGFSDLIGKFGGKLKLLGAAGLAAGSIAILTSTIKNLREEMRETNREIDRQRDAENQRQEQAIQQRNRIGIERLSRGELFGSEAGFSSDEARRRTSDQVDRLSKRFPSLAPFIEQAAIEAPEGQSDQALAELAALIQAEKISFPEKSEANLSRQQRIDQGRGIFGDLAQKSLNEQDAILQRGRIAGEASRDIGSADGPTKNIEEFLRLTGERRTPEEIEKIAKIIQALDIIEEGGKSGAFDTGRDIAGAGLKSAFTSRTFEEVRASQILQDEGLDIRVTEADLIAAREGRRQIRREARQVIINAPNQRISVGANGRDPRKNGGTNASVIEGGL